MTELNIVFTLPKEGSNPTEEPQVTVSPCSPEADIGKVDSDRDDESNEIVVSLIDQPSYTIESTTQQHAKSRDDESGELLELISASSVKPVEESSPGLGAEESNPILVNADEEQVKKISHTIIRLSQPVSALSSGSNTSANSVYYDTVEITPERIVEKGSRAYPGGSVSRESVASVYYDAFTSPVQEESNGELSIESSSWSGYAESASEETVIECPYGVVQNTSSFDSNDKLNDLKIKAQYIVERAIDNARLVLFQYRVRDPVNISNSDITFDRTLTPVDKSASDVGHLKGASPFFEQVCAEGESTRRDLDSNRHFDLLSNVKPEKDNCFVAENKNNNRGLPENENNSCFPDSINDDSIIGGFFNEKSFVHDISAGEAPQELNISFEEGYSREFLEEYLEEESHFSEDESPETTRAVFDVILEGRHSSLGEFKQVGIEGIAEENLIPADPQIEGTADNYQTYLDASCHQFREELENQALGDNSVTANLTLKGNNTEIKSLFAVHGKPKNCPEIKGEGEIGGEFLIEPAIDQEEVMAHSAYVAGQRKVCLL